MNTAIAVTAIVTTIRDVVAAKHQGPACTHCPNDHNDKENSA